MQFECSKNSLLFLGAGFSTGAINLLGEPVPTGGKLREKLCKATNLDEGDSRVTLEIASEEYEEKYSTDELINLLIKSFTVKDFNKYYNAIVSKHWLRVYTTNYDDLYLSACSKNGIDIVIKTPMDVAANAGIAKDIIHIYGSVKRVDKNRFIKDFVLTEKQRDAGNFQNSQWYKQFNYDLLACDVAYFVGFSLDDFSIKTILSRMSERAKEKIRFIDFPGAPSFIQRRLKRYGQFVDCGVEVFSQNLFYQTKINSHPIPPTELRVVELSDYKKSTSTDIDRLLVAGYIEKDCFSRNLFDRDENRYSFVRSDGLMRRLADRVYKPVIIHSDIGNGKSVLLNQLQVHKAASGYAVFEIKPHVTDLSAVVSYVSSFVGDMALFIDDLQIIHMGIIPLINAMANKPGKEIFIGVRSSLIDSGVTFVHEVLNRYAPIVVDINSIEMKDQHRVLNYFNENALWGDEQGLSDAEKIRIIQKDCGGSLRDLVIRTFKRGRLAEKVVEIGSHINELSEDSRNLIILSSLFLVAGIDNMNEMYITSEIAGNDVDVDTCQTEIKSSEGGMLFAFPRGVPVLRSPTLGLFILKEVVSDEDIFKASKKALIRIDTYFHDDIEMEEISRALLKYSTHRKVSSNAKSYFKAMVREFFHEMRTLKIAQRDPLFHVQRSIASLESGDFLEAERFIAAAYSTARGIRKFDTYQIDTHKARFIFEKAAAEKFSSSGEEIDEARGLLSSVVERRGSDMYHPLHVVERGLEVINASLPSITPEQNTAMYSFVEFSDMLSSKKYGEHSSYLRIAASIRRQVVMLRKHVSRTGA